MWWYSLIDLMHPILATSITKMLILIVHCLTHTNKTKDECSAAKQFKWKLTKNSFWFITSYSVICYETEVKNEMVHFDSKRYYRCHFKPSKKKTGFKYLITDSRYIFVLLDNSNITLPWFQKYYFYVFRFKHGI